MHTLFISDLHLNSASPHLTELFLQFLGCHTKNADALYILGDLFELWVGNDALDDHYLMITHALQKLTQSIPIYFLPGNRDFLINQKFAQLTGIKLIKDPTVIHLYDTPTLLMHGDNLCTQDKLHQIYRKISHSNLIKQFFLALPLSWRQKIAYLIRNNSKKRVRSLEADSMDAAPYLIQTLLQKFNVQQLIYGHTHKPAINLLWQNNYLKQYFVLSDWNERGNMLICDKKGEKRLIYFSKITKNAINM